MASMKKSTRALLEKAAQAVEFAVGISYDSGGSGTCVIRMSNGQARALATYLNECLARDDAEGGE
jgi:hypothetical protein